MLIKFLSCDPRAGTVVRMDSSRGQQLIDAGAAEQVSESGEPLKAKVTLTTEPPTEASKPKVTRGKK